MAPEEEKEELEQAPADPASGEQEPVEQETAEEKKSKNYWWLSLGLILLLLAGGGYYALTGMRQAAHKLAGGSDYDQLSANSSIYDGGTGAAKNGNYFPLDEETAGPAAGGAKTDRINSSLIRTREELVADASAARPAPTAAVKGEDGSSSAEASGAAQGAQAAMGEKLQARASFSGGAMGSKGAKGSPLSSAGAAAAFQGNGTAVGKASEQRETRAGTPKKAGRGSVMESLKGAFRASFYGARLASQDSAKSWIARSFDGSPEATTAIEYDEKMRAKLDRVNPGAIPNFLREQDVSAAEAKRLTASDVSKPSMDKEATKEALAEDKDYQKKKLAKDFSSSMLNGLFAGVSGGGSPEGDDDGAGVFSDPEDERAILEEELQDWVDTNGFGGECGCSAEAPCCCMPNSGDGAGVSDGGGMIGDFSDYGGGDFAFA